MERMAVAEPPPAGSSFGEQTSAEPTPAEQAPASAPESAGQEPPANEAVPVDSTDGVDESGRAVNDPRVAAKSVDEVNIETQHSELFSGEAAAPVEPTRSESARAANDPRK